MAATLNSIVEKIQHLSPQRFHSYDMSRKILGVKSRADDQMVHDQTNHGQNVFEKDILYVLRSDDYSNELAGQKGANFLCIGEEPIVGNEISEQNIIVIQNRSCDLDSVIDEIADLLLAEQRFEADSLRLIHSLFAQKGIQYILDEAHELFQNPIFIMDSSFKKIAATKSYSVNDVIWKDLQENDYYTYENIRLSKLDHRYSKIMSSDKILYVNVQKNPQKLNLEDLDFDVLYLPDGYLNNSRITSHVPNKDHVVAHFTIIEYNTPFDHYHFKLAKVLRDVILCYIQTFQFNQRIEGHLYESLFADLLSGKVNNQSVLNDRLKTAGWVLNENFYVFCVGGGNPTQSDLAVLRKSLSGLIPNSKSVHYEGCLVYIINHNFTYAISPDHLEKIKIFLEENNLYGGLSYPFKNLLEVSQYYGQAVRTIELISKYNPQLVYATYERCTLLHSIDLTASKTDITNLCHPSLLKLIDHDFRKNTEYTKTLYAFLHNTNDYVKTAKELNIHRNSMDYRVKRIEEILELDLTDALSVWHLYISFEILKYLKNMPF